MTGKKGVSMGINVVIILVIALTVAAIVLFQVLKGGNLFGEGIKQTSPTELRIRINSCRIGAGELKDSDGDGLPDNCDPCWGGNDRTDQSDNDWVADACDVNPESDDATPYEACCGIKPEGKTNKELEDNCERLISADPFRCRAKGIN